MKLIELSYVIRTDSPRWPTNPEEKMIFEQSADRGDGCNASSVYHHMHNGTHVDAPRHFCPQGKTIDCIPVEDFYYQAPYVWRIPKRKGECITVQDIRVNEDKISEADILFIYTGYSELREKSPKDFTDDFPFISGEAASYLRGNFPKLKAIALDTLSVDSGVTGSMKGFPAHHALLDTYPENASGTLLIYEDVNVKMLLGYEKIHQICAFPLRFHGLEASPVSMVAFVQQQY